jgi:hypothetical protein
MLDDQFAYLKRILEKRRDNMEEIWTVRELDMAIRIFEWETQNAINKLFHV